MECVVGNISAYVVGTILCVGGLLSYIPQYYNLIKTKQHKGVSELSLYFLNLSGASLTLNSLIFNWNKFPCYNTCSIWLCTADLLSFYQICINWIAVFPLYLVFLWLKIINSILVARIIK